MLQLAIGGMMGDLARQFKLEITPGAEFAAAAQGILIPKHSIALNYDFIMFFRCAQRVVASGFRLCWATDLCTSP